jgi:hypothetical protein
VLEAPLPFTQADYESDFRGTVPAFRELLGRAAHKLELDGARRDDEDPSYEAVGRAGKALAHLRALHGPDRAAADRHR